MSNERWWGIEHICGGERREYPVLHWADEPEVGAGPRQAFQCDACGDRYLFHEDGAALQATGEPPTADPHGECGYANGERGEWRCYRSEGAAPRAEGLDPHRLGGLIERAIRDSKRQSGGLLPDGWTLVEMALAYPPETPTEPSQSIPSRPSDERVPQEEPR